MWRSHGAEPDRTGKTAVTLFSGDNRQQTVGVHGVHRLHFREFRLQLLIERYAGGGPHQIINFGPRHAQVERFENRFSAVRNFVDTHNRHVAPAGVVTGKLTEGPFNFTFPAFNHPFQDHFRPPRHIETGQRSRRNRIRAFT